MAGNAERLTRLVLTRKRWERAVLPDLGIEIRVTSIRDGRVQLAFTAPESVKITRPSTDEDAIDRAAGAGWLRGNADVY